MNLNRQERVILNLIVSGDYAIHMEKYDISPFSPKEYEYFGNHINQAGKQVAQIIIGMITDKSLCRKGRPARLSASDADMLSGRQEVLDYTVTLLRENEVQLLLMANEYGKTHLDLLAQLTPYSKLTLRGLIKDAYVQGKIKQQSTEGRVVMVVTDEKAVEPETTGNDIANGSHYKKGTIQQKHVGQPLDPFLIDEIMQAAGKGLTAFQVTVLKKALALGQRGMKSEEQDLKDIIGACTRKLEIIYANDKEI